MPDLDAALLVGAMRFALLRLNATVGTVADTPEKLLSAVLGQAPSAAQLTQLGGVRTAVAAGLGTANAATADLQTALATPPSTRGEAGAAASQLSAALQGLATGVTALANGVTGTPETAVGMQAVLRRATASVSDSFGGLVTQLGLSGPGDTASSALTVAGTTVTLILGNPVSRPVSGAAVFALAASSFTATVDWADPASLQLQLKTQLVAGLVTDAMVRQLLPGGTSASTQLTVTVDLAKGISFGPGVKHRVALPGGIDTPYIDFRDFALELPDASELQDSSAPPAFEITATIAGAFGPIAATVDGLGVQLVMDTDAIAAGADSPASLQPRPPTGAGLRVDVGPVRGGGYVFHKGTEYGGALDLAIGPIEIKAIGLIGTDPFSLVLVLSVEFRPGIQLSFGFTLNGVGGLLALERTVSTDALRAGIHDHSIDSLLFPADPVGSAPHILSALEKDFPPEPGAFVVGPMLELGWGTPVSLVVAKVGVIIALPDPKVIIIGSVRVALPTAQLAIIDLKATLYGEITPDHILVLVSLEGSKAAGFALGGDFGLLIGYGDDPELAISAGGFHPHYKPPAELTGMHRVMVDLSPPAIVTLRAEAYFALTSNSFQLGAMVQLKAEVAGVGAEGHLSFDALVRWAPTFAFEIDLSAGICLYAFGISFASIDLHLSLSGPAPWAAHGTASISLLFFDVDFEVGPITWGDGANPTPDAVSPVDLVHDALAKPSAWHSVPPDGGDRVASLCDVIVPGAILVHPLGGFELRQKAVPLETVIDKVGAHPVSEREVSLGGPTVDGHPAAAVSGVTDSFAPGQFVKLSDDQKLSTPAFEQMPSGMRFGGVQGQSFGAPVQSSYQWDTVYPQEELERRREAVLFSRLVLGAVLSVGPAARSDLRAPDVYAVRRETISLADPGSVRIVSTSDLSVVDGVDASTMTTTAASRALADLVATDPERAGTLQIVGLGVAP